jgi:murein DD-endopeptidase MepM/ murein hydrolase activator NlpD
MERMRRTALAAALLALALGCASTPDEPGAGDVVHVLQPGENLYRLSRYYGVSVQDIMSANDIDNVSDIPTGARLVIPGTARKPPPSSLAAYLPSTPGGHRGPSAHAAGLDFAWPVRGTLSSRYGWRSGSHHEGIDISARRGTPVHAAEAGRVIYSGWLGSYGRVVIVKHVGDWSTVYAHNQRNRVEEGDFVERGDVLAEVGASGNASGPHCHFEVRRDRAPEDPLAYLP